MRFRPRFRESCAGASFPDEGRFTASTSMTPAARARAITTQDARVPADLPTDGHPGRGRMKAAVQARIGGDLSHEFIVLCPRTGGGARSFYDAAYERLSTGSNRNLRLRRRELGSKACFRTGSTRPTPPPTRPTTSPNGRSLAGGKPAGLAAGSRSGNIFNFGEQIFRRDGASRLSGPRRHAC